MIIETLRSGSRGANVALWQYFLIGQGHLAGAADGEFGPITLSATKEFQKKYKLFPDGVVGRQTLAKALKCGYGCVSDRTDDEMSSLWPARPHYIRGLGPEQKIKLYGDFRYVPAPSKGNPEGIRILGDWTKKNIVRVKIPQLKNVRGSYHKDTFYFHKDVAEKVQLLFLTWEKAGLIDKVLTWGGSWVPRFIRGSRSVLSNHAYGTAFDINVPWNMLGHEGALKGKRGSVRELVIPAAKLGFVWGGFWPRRPDPMHFEIGQIIEDS